MSPTIRLTFLGTGAPVPTAQRVQTGLLLEMDDSCVLVDCGSGVLHRLAQSDIAFGDVTNVLFTHLHPDHVADLLPFLRTRQFVGAPSLEIAGPSGIDRLVDKTLAVHEYHRDDFDLTVREVGPGNFSIGTFDVTAIETQHVVYCLAYRCTPSSEDGPIFTFSGDSDAFDELAAFADGSDVLVHDCAHTDTVDETPHATPSTLGTVLADHRFGRVYLTHLYPETDGCHEEMLRSIRRQYDGDVQVAYDGLIVEM